MMRRQLERFSAYLLLAGLLIMAVGVSIFIIYGQQRARTVELVLALGLALVGLFVVSRPTQVRRVMAGRTAVYGSNTVLMSVAFLGILVLINLLVARHPQRLDVTADKRFTLSPQTIQILEGLKEPIKITMFFSRGDSRQEDVKNLLKEYTAHTDMLTYEFVDPDERPALARQYGITSYGTLVFERGDKRQTSFSTDEQGLTSAILKVSRDEVKVVYFVTGHKERDPNGYDANGYSRMKQALEKDNYEVKLLNLATITDTVPADTAAVVEAGPQSPLLEKEREVLARYLDDGGRLMVLVDPGQPDPLGDLLEGWGMRLRDDVVIDVQSAFFGDVASPMVSRYNFSAITKDMGGLTSFFTYARSIETLEPAPEGVTVTSLAESSTGSWGETDLQSSPARYDEDSDTKGPLVLAATAEKSATGTRLVVVGDSDFVANNVIGSISGALGNADLFLNAVNWLAEEEELISIRPKPPTARQIFLTPPQINFIFYSTVILLPLGVLAVGASVWWRRR